MHFRVWPGIGLQIGVMMLAEVCVAGAGEAGRPRKHAVVGPARCARAVVEGEIRAGQEFRKRFAGGLDFLMEPIASGWVVRVLPTEGERPLEDYAEIATPPVSIGLAAAGEHRFQLPGTGCDWVESEAVSVRAGGSGFCRDRRGVPTVERGEDGLPGG